MKSSSSFNDARATWYGIVGNTDVQHYFSRVFSVPPTFRGTNPDGEYLIGVRGTGDANVRVYMDALQRDNNTDKFTMTQAFTISLMKGLDLKLSGSWYYQNALYESFNRDYMTGVNAWYTRRESSNEYDRVLNQTYNIVGTYNTAIKKHSINAMAGFEYYISQNKGFYAYGYNAPTDGFQDLGLTQNEGRKVDSWHSENRIMSFFGKVDYDYDGKYLLSAVLRRDGYSRLHKDERWGIFPGVSAGWIVSKESFFEPLKDIMSFAKLRASYGANGNVDTNYIGNYTVQGAYGTTTKYNGGGSNVMTSLPNPVLTWEKSIHSKWVLMSASWTTSII